MALIDSYLPWFAIVLLVAIFGGLGIQFFRTYRSRHLPADLTPIYDVKGFWAYWWGIPVRITLYEEFFVYKYFQTHRISYSAIRDIQQFTILRIYFQVILIVEDGSERRRLGVCSDSQDRLGAILEERRRSAIAG